MKNDGKNLERETKQVLSLTGWKVSDETLIGHKKVDLLIRKNLEFGQLKTYAVECKDYNSILTKKQVSEIFSDYLPLLQDKKIDGLLLITKNGIAPSAQTYVENNSSIIHNTIEVLSNSILDFSTYISSIIQSYNNSGLEEYYIQQDYYNQNDKKVFNIEKDILDWINNEKLVNPIAVLGSYGMGKSTLAQRISFLVGKEFLEKGVGRIPILIKLDEISNDQSIEGLLGKHLASTSIVSNYNFSAFEHLNHLGRFVILFDGFDEMKRAMSWESMRYNFNQINTLYNTNSKIILLGRPNSFLDQDEYNEALHGIRKIGQKNKKIVGAPDYEEKHLAPFDEDQIHQFIHRFCEFSKSESSHQLLDLLKNGDEKTRKLIDSLIHRPVQLKMLIEVLPSYRGEIDNLTTSVLYSEFIDLVIRREQRKKERQEFNYKERRKFASKLAYWMWTEKSGLHVSSHDIPDELFNEFRKERKEKEIELSEIKRDLLTACFLERKAPNGFYFSHKSFQEFLVAEILHSKIINHNLDELINLPYVTPEVSYFLCQLFNRREFEKWVDETYRKVDDIDFSPSYVNLFVDCCKEIGYEITKKKINYLKGRRGSWITLKEKELPAKTPHPIRGVTKKKKYKQSKGKK